VNGGGHNVLKLKVKKLIHAYWCNKKKERLSEKRKKVEAARSRAERTAPVPADAPISFAEAAARLCVGHSTLREWRRSGLFPEPKRYNRRLWFTKKQVALLKRVKEFNQIYRMRSFKVKQNRKKELRAFIFARWN
jgi:hypothetical protein